MTKLEKYLSDEMNEATKKLVVEEMLSVEDLSERELKDVLAIIMNMDEDDKKRILFDIIDAETRYDEPSTWFPVLLKEYGYMYSEIISNHCSIVPNAVKDDSASVFKALFEYYKNDAGFLEEMFHSLGSFSGGTRDRINKKFYYDECDRLDLFKFVSEDLIIRLFRKEVENSWEQDIGTLSDFVGYKHFNFENDEPKKALRACVFELSYEELLSQKEDVVRILKLNDVDESAVMLNMRFVELLNDLSFHNDHELDINSFNLYPIIDMFKDLGRPDVVFDTNDGFVHVFLNKVASPSEADIFYNYMKLSDAVSDTNVEGSPKKLKV